MKSATFKEHSRFEPVCPHCGNEMPERHYVPNRDGDGYMHRGECYDKGPFAINWPESTYFEEISKKIENKEVTTEDFNRLISEASLASTTDRVRRRTRKTPTDSHIDAEGHQHLTSPKFSARVSPKLEPVGDNQMSHRGKAAHKASTRTQRRKHRKFGESIDFVATNIGKPITESMLGTIINKSELSKVITYMLKTPNINRDWLWALQSKIG